VKKYLSLLLLLIALPVLVLGVKKILDIRKGAAGKPANIVIDVSQAGGEISQNLWQNFAQGGEEPKDMLVPAVAEIKALNPKIIRIDHIFDFYTKVNGDSFNFDELDKVVRTILTAGAVPMFSLSYMPVSMSRDGQLTSPPKDWGLWQKLIKETVSRYSGKNGFNLTNVYYEVWNEPDLFGKWHYGKDPNYLVLYQQTVSAAQSVAGVNSFKIGGPATTGFYPNWLKAILKFCYQNKLRMDFVSWHRYTKDLKDYGEDFEKLNRILTDYPEYFSLERLITEYGPDSENSPWYDNKVAAAHAIAGSLRLLGKVHRVFAFEIKDGPDPQGKKFWGRWGLLTHENTGLEKKPRYFAYQFLNKLLGKRLSLTGEGSWVAAAASQDGKTIKVLLVNYDSADRHFETVPVTLKNLAAGKYQFKTSYFMGNETTIQENLTGIDVVKNIFLEPNAAVMLEWIRTN
jgi:beta-xylosidase